LAAELAAGYVSLTVKLAKGGMADVTKEVKKAGTEGGQVYSDEFGKQVEKDIGKKLPDTIGKATKQGGGIIKAAKEAADEFGKGFREGVDQALGQGGGDFVKGLRDGVKQAIEEHGGVASTLDTLSDKITTVSDAISGIGDTFGAELDGIESASKTVTDAIDGISTSVTSTKTALDAFKTGDVGGGLQATVDALKGLEGVGLPTGVATTAQQIADDAENARTQIDGVIGPLQTLTELAGPDSKLYNAGKKLPLVGDFIEFSKVAYDSGVAVEDFIRKKTGLEVPLSGVSVVKQLTNDFNDLNSAASNAQAKLDAALAAARAQGPPPAYNQPAPPQANPTQRDPNARRGQRASGGGIYGAGGPTSDIIPIWASPGEHVLTAAEVNAMGGQQAVYGFRNWLMKGYAGGGAVDNPDVAAAMNLVGTAYSQGARNDCSGMVARVINATLGTTGGGLMSTKTAQSWLAARGFVPGRGGPGQISVGWYDHGPNPNDGHMAMTLSDGENAEAGGSHGTFLVGAGAKGADSPQFDQHMYLPTLFGEGPGASGGPSSSTSGGGTGGGGSGGGGGGGGSTALSDNPMKALQQLGEQQQALDMQKGEQVKKLLPDFGQLADIAAGGIKETLLPPGFSDPTQWKSTKSVGALLGWIGGLTGDPATASIMGGIGSALTGSGSGLYEGIMGAVPQPFGTLAPTADQFAPADQQHLGTGAAPGPAAPGVPGIQIGTLNDNSGKALQTAQKESDIHNSPQTTHLTRLGRQ
jgi:hypothetical protein